MNTSHDDIVRVGSPAELLTSIPALLGFYPDRSVVLMAYDELTQRVGEVARVDFELGPDGAPSRGFRRGVADAMYLLRLQEVEFIHAVAVAPGPERALRVVRDLVDEYALGPGGYIEVLDAFAVPEIADGARWTCAHGADGRLPDPATCAATVAALVAGRRIRGSRDELLAEVAATGPGIGEEACLAAAGPDVPDARLLGDLVAAVTTPGPLPDGAAARLGGALLRLDVRDAALAFSATPYADAAHELFCTLARVLRGGPRAAAATLVAGLAYIRGDGAILGIALAAALETDRRYRAAVLLGQAFEAGLRPEQMAGLADIGAEVAARLGVALPPGLPGAVAG